MSSGLKFQLLLLSSKVAFGLYAALGITNAVFLGLTNMEDGPGQIYKYVMAGSILSFVCFTCVYFEIIMCCKGILQPNDADNWLVGIVICKIFRWAMMIVMLGFGINIYDNGRN